VTVDLNLTETARKLRKESTDAEQLLWRYLRRKQLHGLKFRRQEQIGRFIADFVCYENALIIEADGGQHAVEKEKDLERTAWLNSQGFTVLRFWNNEILSNTEGVLEVIYNACGAAPPGPLPDPLPPRGEGASPANLCSPFYVPAPSEQHDPRGRNIL
jgi:very-short-patch-repair endonuclease